MQIKNFSSIQNYVFLVFPYLLRPTLPLALTNNHLLSSPHSNFLTSFINCLCRHEIFPLVHHRNCREFRENFFRNLHSTDKLVNRKIKINYNWVPPPPKRSHISVTHSEVCDSNPGQRAACSSQNFTMWLALV
jgi:hypothetical protein